jgi:hypothetical protein
VNAEHFLAGDRLWGCVVGVELRAKDGCDGVEEFDEMGVLVKLGRFWHLCEFQESRERVVVVVLNRRSRIKKNRG